jgi:hypothetical protein
MEAPLETVGLEYELGGGPVGGSQLVAVALI